MKTIFFGLIVLIFCGCAPKTRVQKNDEYLSLNQRLKEFLQCYKELNIDKMINYVYPKVFTISPQDSVIKRMKASIVREVANFKPETVEIDTLYPIFGVDNGRYAKISCSFIMLFDLDTMNDSLAHKTPNPTTKEHLISLDAYPSPKNAIIKILLDQEFGEENVSLDNVKGVAHIHVTSQLVAIRDKYAKEWSFLKVEEDSLTTKVLSKQILDKLSTYK